ncbi:MAG: sulfotransferase family protein [Chloroflexota bacterium]
MSTFPSRRVSVWSGPRNVSTALMYSFSHRADTVAVDEPFYGYYLSVSDAVHPGADEIIASMECDRDRVISNLTEGSFPANIVFFKNMPHHLVDVPWDFMIKLTNVMLIRDPVEMLPSLAQVLETPIQRDTGYKKQMELHQHLLSQGHTVPVLDSREILLDPAGVLEQLCQQIDIPFDKAMLQWPSGPKPEDGVWAKFWYHSLHKSTGFQPYRPKTAPFPDKLNALLDECQPYYDYLYQHAIKASVPSQ